MWLILLLVLVVWLGLQLAYIVVEMLLVGLYNKTIFGWGYTAHQAIITIPGKLPLAAGETMEFPSGFVKLLPSNEMLIKVSARKYRVNLWDLDSEGIQILGNHTVQMRAIARPTQYPSEYNLRIVVPASFIGSMLWIWSAMAYIIWVHQQYQLPVVMLFGGFIGFALNLLAFIHFRRGKQNMNELIEEIKAAAQGGKAPVLEGIDWV